MKRRITIFLVVSLMALGMMAQDREHVLRLGDFMKPKGLTLPAYTAGQYLTNDGTNLSWGAISFAGYLKADGTVPLTADWNVGAFDLTVGGLTVDATASSEATLGDTLITNGDFAANDLTGWTAAAGWSAATGKAVHTAGIADTTALVQAVSVTNGSVYQVQCTTSARTAGTLTLTLGALTGSYAVSTNGTYYYTFTATATASVNLTFTPNAEFDGAIDDISVKLVTPNATPIINLLDSTSTSVVPIRASAALFNLGMGDGVLRYNTTGTYNVGYGTQALYSNTTGSYNSAQGYKALYYNTTGGYNSAQGYRALYSNTTGNSNSAQGYQALYSNTTGFSNSAQGYHALYFNTTGSYNSAQGYQALYSNTTGIFNSAQGYQALYPNTTGSYNSAQGYQAGRYIANGTTANTTSDYSTYLGTDTKASVDNAQNETVIGYNAIGAGSNTIQLGNTSVTNVNTSGSYSQTGANAQKTAINQATVVVTTTAAATATATNLIPAGSIVLGVTCRNTTAVTGDAGFTGYDIGDGSDVDRWGANVNPAINETTDLTDCTITSVPIYAAATSVVLTQVGGSTFIADKTIRVTVHYISLTAPTS